MSKIVRLKNLTPVEQSIFVGNRRVVLESFAEKDFEETVGNAFLQACDGLVEEVAEVAEPGAAYMADPDTGLIWLANLTGDPDAPKTIKRKKRLPRGEWEWVDDPNPLAEAIDVVRELDGGMREYDTADGLMADNIGKSEIRIPKYGRKPFPKDIANWMLQRDANAGWISPNHRGRIGISRPKSTFEPDMGWALDDMRCYLTMLDRNAVVGPKESVVKEQAAATGQDVNDSVREAKILCMKRLHHRVAKRDYRLISKAEFDTFKATFENDGPAIDSAAMAQSPSKPRARA